MERELASAAEREVVRRHHHRNGGVANAHARVLKNARGKFELVVFLVNGEHEHHGEVGAGAEVGSVVRDNESAEIFFGNVNTLMHGFEHFAANAVHFGAELEVEDSVADVD